jgi:hypothetical protein
MLLSFKPMMRNILFVLLLLPLACVDPYKIELKEGEQLLSVEGYITTEAGPHVIKLSRTDTYGSIFEGLIRPVSQATVAIRDSEGKFTYLTEQERGDYVTPEGFRGKVGLSYSLQIELLDGTVYTSLPEKINPVVKIDSVSYQALSLPTKDRLNDRIGVQLVAHFKDEGNDPNFYYWRTSGESYVLVANPELYTLPPNDPINPRGPAPKDCCAICYFNDRRFSLNFAIATNERFKGRSSSTVVDFIDDDGLRFKDTYKILVHQMSISPSAHRFLRLVQQQINVSGSIFDQPPATIRGNIINVKNPDEVVLGYFIAADSDTKEIYIYKNRLSGLGTPGIIPDDCRTVRGATLNPPKGWNPR